MTLLKVIFFFQNFFFLVWEMTFANPTTFPGFLLHLPDLHPTLSFPPSLVGGWLHRRGSALVDDLHAGAAVESAPPPAEGSKTKMRDETSQLIDRPPWQWVAG